MGSCFAKNGGNDLQKYGDLDEKTSFGVNSLAGTARRDRRRFIGVG
jgi:hypothetical protein